MALDVSWDTLLSDASRCRDAASRAEAMELLLDILWPALKAQRVSWIGFYALDPAADPPQLVLCARRDRSACSPIPLHGACGRSLLARRPLVVHDVRDLGGAYVACDSRDLSEIVVPCFSADGRAWGVFDADSHAVGTFADDDARWLGRILEAAGISCAQAGPAPGGPGLPCWESGCQAE